MVPKLSVVIITKNEEHNIAKAVMSANFADEILVVDSGSTDKTQSIAMNLGAKVFYKSWMGYGRQKNYALKLTVNDWVLVIDADEVITPGLREEIEIKLIENSFDGFYVPRLNKFFGREIRYCGLYPDYSIRLFNKNRGRFSNSEVHESVRIDGKVGYLTNNLKHEAYLNIKQFINKQKKYAKLSEKKPNIIKAILSPIWVFIKIYFLRFGFLEGWRGVVIAFVYSLYTFWKYYR